MKPRCLRKGAILSAHAPQAGGGAGAGGLSVIKPGNTYTVKLGVYPDSVPSNISSADNLRSEAYKQMVGTGARCETVKWIIKGVCSKCGYPVDLNKSSCGRLECPDCYKGWARRASDRVGLRVWGYLHALGRYGHERPWHIVLSIPGCTEWQKYKALAQKYGCTGGVMVIHPFRVKPGVQRVLQEQASAAHLNRYDFIRKHELWHLLEFSPHAHIIGFGYLIENTPAAAFQYRKIRPLMDRGAVERAAYYLLSHAMMPAKSKHLVKYFGVCSYAKLGRAWQGFQRLPMACPCCGSDVHEEGTNAPILLKSSIALGWFLRSKQIKPG